MIILFTVLELYPAVRFIFFYTLEVLQPLKYKKRMPLPSGLGHLTDFHIFTPIKILFSINEKYCNHHGRLLVRI